MTEQNPLSRTKGRIIRTSIYWLACDLEMGDLDKEELRHKLLNGTILLDVSSGQYPYYAERRQTRRCCFLLLSCHMARTGMSALMPRSRDVVLNIIYYSHFSRSWRARHRRMGTRASAQGQDGSGSIFSFALVFLNTI